MARFGLIGPSYTSQSLTADCQTTRNWYTEIIESQEGKSAMALYPTPGTKSFLSLPGKSQVRAQLEINGRAFAVISDRFIEYFANAALNVSFFATVINDQLPASMVASPQQILIASGGALYVFYLQSVGTVPAGTFVQISPATFDGLISQVAFSDGFFLALIRNSAEFYTSQLFDAANWTTPNVNKIIVSTTTDNVQSMTVNQRRIWLHGRKQANVYYDSGSSQIFDVDPSGTIENGSVAIFGTVRADNSVFWIDQDERGGGIARRASGYTPVRVSNHAVEFAWQGYSDHLGCYRLFLPGPGAHFHCVAVPNGRQNMGL
jgi:hypothetical protein